MSDLLSKIQSVMQGPVPVGPSEVMDVADRVARTLVELPLQITVPCTVVRACGPLKCTIIIEKIDDE